MNESRWLAFRLSRDTGTTQVWDVVSLSSGSVLGQVQWFGKWRQYAFYSHLEIILNADCLGEILAFVRTAMARRKNAGATREGSAEAKT